MESEGIDRGKTPPEEGGGKEECKQIIVVLMGLPGSGKSTFCKEVLRISCRRWAHVCQDTINHGKAGTKTKCLSVAAAALEDGKSVLIDMRNIDGEQRADFLKLGGPETEKHAVVLDLPPTLCISRSVKHSGHKGSLQGGRAAEVVNQMVLKKELPKLSEGLNRITFCYNDKDVKEAIKAYGSLGQHDSPPSGCFGQKSSDAMVQVGISNVFKKGDTPGNDESKTKDSGIQGVKTGSHKGGELDSTTSTSGSNASGSIPTLAFPSISTEDFHFNLEKASDIIVEKVEEYIGRIGKAKLVLVDLSPESKILSLVKIKAAKKNLDSNKFSMFVGDITRLRSQGGLHCNVIANATNWRLKPGGGGVNAAIFKAAGSELVTATMERAKTLAAGKCVVVPLPSSSTLFAEEGVTHVIHVRGPNMNPMRPDCLKDDYTEGCKILREVYSSMFEGFISIVKSHGSKDHNGKRAASYIPENNKKSKGPTGSNSSQSQTGVNNQNRVEEGNTTKTWGNPWAQALRRVVVHPDNDKDVVFEVSDNIVVIKDVYPKAQRHVLVIARSAGLDSIADVSREHIPLLKEMHVVGLKWAENFILEDNSMAFRMGYHSVPSMPQLHLHVISQDFDSIDMRNKKHWCSFTTQFFVDSKDVIEELEEVGKVMLRDEKLLQGKLCCHRCLNVYHNMPKLKYHVRSCEAPLLPSLLENGRLITSERKYL